MHNHSEGDVGCDSSPIAGHVVLCDAGVEADFVRPPLAILLTTNTSLRASTSHMFKHTTRVMHDGKKAATAVQFSCVCGSAVAARSGTSHANTAPCLDARTVLAACRVAGVSRAMVYCPCSASSTLNAQSCASAATQHNTAAMAWQARIWLVGNGRRTSTRGAQGRVSGLA